MLDKLRKERVSRARQEGSPIVRDEPGVIAATTGRYHVTIEDDFPRLRKYVYATEVNIWNNGSVTLQLEINGRPYALIPANFFAKIEEPAIHSATLINESGSATGADDLVWTFQRAPVDADQRARELG